MSSLDRLVGRLLNEIECRIDHGAESGGHLEYVRNELREILGRGVPRTIGHVLRALPGSDLASIESRDQLSLVFRVTYKGNCFRLAHYPERPGRPSWLVEHAQGGMLRSDELAKEVERLVNGGTP